jgi:hypothetical protein
VVVFLPQEVVRRLRRAYWKRGSILKIVDGLGDADQTVQAAPARQMRTRVHPRRP